MANYYGATRTNYFRVNDEAGFEKFLDHILPAEDELHVWSEMSEDGTKYYGFGCYSGLIGYVEDPEDEFDYCEAWDKFVEGLQKFVADDDAVIIMEAGNEKLRYVTGIVTIITKKDAESMDMRYFAIDRARELLGYSWNTKCEY